MKFTAEKTYPTKIATVLVDCSTVNDVMSVKRRASLAVTIGGVRVGGTPARAAPIMVQSMTNTDTADIEGTAQQVKALARAGSEVVRVTVNSAEAAAAVAPIVERLAQLGAEVPLVGDFHFNGHKLLHDHPECAAALAKSPRPAG